MDLIQKLIEVFTRSALEAVLIVFLGLSILLLIMLFITNRRLRSELTNPSWIAGKLHAWSAFAGRSVRAPGAKSARADLLRVKLYVDHANFFRNWRNMVEDGAHVDTLDWAKLPEVVLGALKPMPIAIQRQVIYCGTNIYVSFHEDEYYDLLTKIRSEKERSPFPLTVELDEIERWRRENTRLIDEITRELPFKFGFLVFPFARYTPGNLRNSTFRPNGVPPAREKLVDTSLCADLIADAIGDVYDLALVFSADVDYSPAIHLVQDEYKKSVGVVGLKGAAGGALGEICRLKIDLNEKDNGKPRYEAMRRPVPADQQTTL